MNLPVKMSTELVAIMMIGDGMLALLQPRRHMRLWNTGPEPWRKLCTYFEERPAQTMAVGAAFVGIGLWLASGQDQEHAYEDQYADPLGTDYPPVYPMEMPDTTGLLHGA